MLGAGNTTPAPVLPEKFVHRPAIHVMLPTSASLIIEQKTVCGGKQAPSNILWASETIDIPCQGTSTRQSGGGSPSG
jgi:hypothetical protein